MSLTSRLRPICTIFDALRINEKKTDLEKKTSQTDFWQHKEKAETILKELKFYTALEANWAEIKQKIGEIAQWIGGEIDEETQKLIDEEIAIVKKNFQKAHIELFLNGPYDQSDATVVISAGTGGVDAQDWAGILLRMYLRHAEKKGWQVALIDKTAAQEAGIKSATVQIRGLLTYGYLKHEHGVHRLVRLSPFNAKNLRQTSFALVEVLPVITEEKVAIDPKDLKIDTYRASGAGGQHVNKTESAVRITHLPTGLVVACQSERSQGQNREQAMQVLRGRLAQKMAEEHKEKIVELKGNYKEAAWGNQIRSYVMQPYTLVKDHRSDIETSQVQAVLDGDLDLFIEGNLVKLAKE